MYNNFTTPYVPNLGNGGGFAQPQQQSPVRSNKVYVTDANDAMMRVAMPDTLMVYFQQDESAIHEVYTDMQGRKMIRTRTLSPIEPAQSGGGDVVTRKEFDELRTAVEALRGSVVHDE